MQAAKGSRFSASSDRRSVRGYASRRRRRWLRHWRAGCHRRHYAEGQQRQLEQRRDRGADVMGVENRVGGDPRSRQLIVVGRPIGRHLRDVIVAVVAIGVRMDLSGRHGRRNHRHQQQQASQLPDRALDPEAHAALEDSQGHVSIMPEKAPPLNPST